MGHSRRRFTLLVGGLIVIATAASASPRVYPPNCTVPAAVRLVSSSAGVPDRTAGEFQIVIRDLANNVSPGASVVVDLSGTPDAVLCSDQEDPDAVANCAAHTVRKFTDNLGQLKFTLLGGSTGMSDAAALAPARIYANGVLVSDIAVSTFDLDGRDGVGANDLSIWLSDFGSGQPHPRSDYDGSGTVGAADLSEWLTVFGRGTSAQSCGASCP